MDLEPRVECRRTTTGGKGNRGKYIERDKRICAAGIPTAQPNLSIADGLDQFLLKDEVDALIGDAIIPPPPPRPLPPLRHPIKPDQRNCLFNSELVTLVNPPELSKFQNLVVELKDTAYKSYWKTPLGASPDPTPMFPTGFDIKNTTYGRPTKSGERLYDIVMPKHPPPDTTRPSLLAGAQTCRNYCKPAFNPDLTYGYRTKIDKGGKLVKCALTDEKVNDGRANRDVLNYIQADYRERVAAPLGLAPTPNNNLSCVSKGYAFGKLSEPDNLPECLSMCTLNPGKSRFLKCLAHLNTLRKVMSTRFLPTFFKRLFLDLKYYDTQKTGWLPKDLVYNYCASKLIRFDASLIEPLLCTWEAFDGTNIKYDVFTLMLNFKQPLPDFPKVADMHPDCFNYSTTYREMTKPGQEIDDRQMAGIPSGRYLDLDYPITPKYYCRANRTPLPQETDINSSLKPCILTLMHVSHRDMYAKRDAATVKRVFEASGETFTDESFNEIWEDAKKYHSQGWVCYETFRKALKARQASPQ